MPVGAVSEPAHHPRHPRARLRVDPALAIQGMRNRRHRNAGGFRDIMNGRL
jgi:hypothetical protein